MINLIPKTEKIKITRSFYSRLAMLALLTFGMVALFAFFAVTPAYFLSVVKNNIIKAKLDTQSAEPVPVPDQKTLLVIKDLGNKIKIVENAEKNKLYVSQKIINAVILKKLPNIKITDIAYETDPVKSSKVTIQGIAPSREMLLLFRKALEDDSAFKQVDLPVSNFIKGSNIKFSLSLTPQ